MGTVQPTHARQQPQHDEARGGGDGDGPQATGHAQFADDVLQLLDGAVRAAEQPFPFRREGNAAVTARQQPHAEELLQCVHLPADR